MVGRNKNKKKYHAVRVGREPGIYNSWDEAEEQVTRFSGAEYCSFRLKKDANKYMEEKPKDQGVAKHQNLEPVDLRETEKPRDKSSEEDENERFLVVDEFNCDNDFEEKLARKDDEIKELREQLDFLWNLYKKDEERISKMESYLQQNDRSSDTSDIADFFPSTPVMNTSTQTENCSSRHHLDDQTDNIFNCHSATLEETSAAVLEKREHERNWNNAPYRKHSSTSCKDHPYYQPRKGNSDASISTSNRFTRIEDERFTKNSYEDVGLADFFSSQRDLRKQRNSQPDAMPKKQRGIRKDQAVVIGDS